MQKFKIFYLSYHFFNFLYDLNLNDLNEGKEHKYEINRV